MRYRNGAALGVAVAALLLGAPVAFADTLLYEKSEQIWLANSDGSKARAITSGGPFELPSESDNGTVIALGPGVNNEDSPTLFGDIYVMNDQGHLNHRIATPEDVVCQPTFPIAYMQISPDASKIAYYESQCASNATWWIPTTATAATDTPGETLGQTSQDSPVWIDNTHLLLDSVTEPFMGPATEFSTYATGAGDDSASPWFSDTDGADLSSGWASFFYSTITRQGDKVAVIETDDNFTPQRVELHVFKTNGAPPAAPTLACTITLPAASDTGTYVETPAFSSDGTLLAFHEGDGIHVINLSSLSNNCSGLSAPLVVAGGNQPAFSAAALPAQGSGPPPPPPPGSKTPALSGVRLGSKKLHKGKGQLTLSYSDSVAGRTTATIERKVTGVKHHSKCVKGKIKKGVKTCTLLTKVSTASRSDTAGANTFTLPVSLTKGLKVGSYELLLVARAAGKHSKTITISFKVV